MLLYANYDDMFFKNNKTNIWHLLLGFSYEA